MTQPKLSALASGKAAFLSHQESQPLRLFRVYCLYRLLVSLILFSLLFFNLRYLGFHYRYLGNYQATVVVYLLVSAFTLLLVLSRYPLTNRHISLSLLIDILILHLMAYFGEGVGSGLTNLIIVSVAAGNILAPGRIGFFYAALATLGTLALAVWGIFSHYETSDSILRAGLLGLIYFAAAFLLQNITRRLMRSEALAQQRAQSILELEQLNHQIIQRMRTGIVVCNSSGKVRLSNLAACELLTGTLSEPRHLKQLPDLLGSRLQAWLANPNIRSEPFRANDIAPQIQANFTQLDQASGQLILIFLEDTSKVAQQAQQLKLASLGRLTAGIAHEIRNPLGAISHAAQLMAESDTLSDGDRRMNDIIQRHSGRVNTIIENVLQLSRRKATEVSQFDLNYWLDEFITEFRQSHPSVIEVTIRPAAEPALVRFDRSQLEQIITNLCENGLRYSEKRTGRASLTLSIGVTDDRERAYIDVQDQGTGIAPEQRASIFEPFYTTETSGTGLGLYLARELCEANQAQLSLVDNDHPGCCFRITFSPYGRVV